MPWSDVNPEFSLIVAPLGLVLLLYAAVGEPLVNRWLYRRLERRRVRDRRALTRTYLIAMVVHLFWIVAIVAAVVLSPAFPFDALGLRLPDNLIPLIAATLAFAAAIGVAFALPKLRRSPPPSGPPSSEEPASMPYEVDAFGAPGGADLASGSSTQLIPPATQQEGYYSEAPPFEAPTPEAPTPEAWAAGAPPHAPSGQQDPADEQTDVLAPRTQSERRMSFLATIIAAIAEELLYRGFLVAFGVSIGLSLWIVAPLSCVLYATGHIYQGWRGLVGPGLLGVLYMVLFLGTGSLVVSIVAHVLLGVSLLLLTGKGRRHRAR